MAIANLKHTWTVSVKNDSGNAVVTDPPLTITGNAEVNWSVQVAAGETAEIDAPVLVAKIVSGFIASNSPVTVYTNADDGAGGQTFVLTGTQSIAWNNTQGTSDFTVDVTRWFVNNLAGSKTATVRGGFLLQE